MKVNDFEITSKFRNTDLILTQNSPRSQRHQMIRDLASREQCSDPEQPEDEVTCDQELTIS